MRSNRLNELALLWNGWLDAHWRRYLIAASTLSLLTFSGYAHVRPLLSDDVLAMIVMRQASAGAIWRALKGGIQVDPPVIDTAVHFVFRLFGEHWYLAEFPAIASFTLLCVCVSLLVKRHAPPVYAAAAFFFPYATLVRGWAMQVRPYAAMMGCSALALFCWDGIQRSSRKTAWRIALTLSLMAAFSTHFYSILLLFPLACGELAKWIVRKRLDWATLFSIALGLIPYLFWSPILINAKHLFTQNYFFPTAFKNLYDFYGNEIESLPMALFLLLLILMALLPGGLGEDAVSQTEPPAEPPRALLAAAAGALLLPVVGYAIGALYTGFFVPYYHMLAVFGVVLGLPLLLAILTGRNRTIGLCLFLALLANGLMVTARGISGFWRPQDAYPSLEEFRSRIPEPNPDIAVLSAHHFLPLYERNRLDPSNNLVYLFDTTKAAAEVGCDSLEISFALLPGLTQARILPFDSYRATHTHWYMAVLGEVAAPLEWQFLYLQKHSSARFSWLGKAGNFDIFRVDLQPLPASGGGQ
jgi:hypothetical protein